MPEPAGSPSNPAPEGSDFTEALPELQAALTADKDDLSDIAEKSGQIAGVELPEVKSLLGKIAESSGTVADKAPSPEDNAEAANKEASRFGKLLGALGKLTEGQFKVGEKIKNAGSSLGTFIREKLAIPALIAFALISTGLDGIFSKVTGLFSFLSSGFFGMIKGVFTNVINGIKNAGWFKTLTGGIANIFTRLGGFFTRVVNFLLKPLQFLGKVGRIVTGILGKIRAVFSFVSGLVTKGFSLVGRVFKVVFKFLKPILKLFGKIFFPINIIIGVVQGVMDFFNAPPGKRGGLGGLLMNVIGGLLETFTFGLLDIERIFGIFDVIISTIKIGIASLPFVGDEDKAARLQAEYLSRAIGRQTSETIREMRREGKSEEEIRQQVQLDRQKRIQEEGLSEEAQAKFDELAKAKDSPFNESLAMLAEATAQNAAAAESTNQAVNTMATTKSAESAQAGQQAAPPPATDPAGGGANLPAGGGVMQPMPAT